MDGVGRVSGDDGLEPRDGAPFALGGFVGRGALVGVGADSFGPYGVPPVPEVGHADASESGDDDGQEAPVGLRASLGVFML